MKTETVSKIVEVWREFEKLDPSVSTDELLKNVAQECHQRGILHSCYVSDVANALIEKGIDRR